jgi:hypothetical protein
MESSVVGLDRYTEESGLRKGLRGKPSLQFAIDSLTEDQGRRARHSSEIIPLPAPLAYSYTKHSKPDFGSARMHLLIVLDSGGRFS